MSGPCKKRESCACGPPCLKIVLFFSHNRLMVHLNLEFQLGSLFPLRPLKTLLHCFLVFRTEKSFTVWIFDTQYKTSHLLLSGSFQDLLFLRDLKLHNEIRVGLFLSMCGLLKFPFSLQFCEIVLNYLFLLFFSVLSFWDRCYLEDAHPPLLSDFPIPFNVPHY